MSDAKLKELARTWVQDNVGGSVPYLRELLRSGEVRYSEAALAWRVKRLESMFESGTRALIPCGSKTFDPESTSHAHDALQVLVGRAPALSQERDREDPGVLVALNPPRRTACTLGTGYLGHLGPIDYEAADPVCENCGIVFPRGGLEGCEHRTTRQLTAGTVCVSCGTWMSRLA